jgi:hypothetical protein
MRRGCGDDRPLGSRLVGSIEWDRSVRNPERFLSTFKREVWTVPRLTAGELRATKRAMASSLRKLATKMATGTLDDPRELRDSLRHEAGLLADFGLALKVIASA